MMRGGHDLQVTIEKSYAVFLVPRQFKSGCQKRDSGQLFLDNGSDPDVVQNVVKGGGKSHFAK